MAEAAKTFRTEQEVCWELGGEIMERGSKHPSLAAVEKEWLEVLASLAGIQSQSASLKRVGVGRTEDPTLIIAHLVPRLRELSTTAALVADQLEERLKRG